MTENLFPHATPVRLSARGKERNPELIGRTGRVSADLGDGCVEVAWDDTRVSWINCGMLEEAK